MMRCMLVLIACVIAVGEVGASAQPPALNPDRPTLDEMLDPGWTWEAPITPVRRSGLEFGATRFVPSGALSIYPMANGSVVVEHARTEGLDLRGSAAPEYKAVLLDATGMPLKQGATSMTSNGKMMVTRHVFRDAGEVGSYGMGVLTLEGRRRLAGWASHRAAKMDAKVLPLPVVGEQLRYELTDME